MTTNSIDAIAHTEMQNPNYRQVFKDIIKEDWMLLLPFYMGYRLFCAYSHLPFKQRIGIAAGAEFARLLAYVTPLPFAWVAATLPAYYKLRQTELLDAQPLEPQPLLEQVQE